MATKIRPRRLPLLALIALLGATTAAHFGINPGRVGRAIDDGQYFVAAQALRDGRGYVLPSQAGPPIRPRYPIGLSAVVALVMKVAPGPASLQRDQLAANVVIVLSGWALALGTYGWLGRAGVRQWPAALIAAATLLHPATFEFLLWTMSDVPFAAMSALMLCRWAGHGIRARGPGWDLCNGLLSGLGMCIRGNGITLLLGSLVAATRGGGRARVVRVAACLLGAVAVLVPADYATKSRAGGNIAGSYRLAFASGWQSVPAGLRTVGRNLSGLAEAVPSIALGDLPPESPAGRAAGAAVWAVVLLGVARLARASRRRDLPAWAHVFGTIGVYLVWPWRLDARFILCLIPPILLAFGRGAGRLAVRPSRYGPAGRRAVLALVLSAACGLYSTARMAVFAARTGVLADPKEAASFDLVLDRISADLPPDAVVVSQTPDTIYLYAGRQGMFLFAPEERLFHLIGRTGRLLARMAEVPGRPFFLCGPPPGKGSDMAEQAAAFAADPGLDIREIYRTPDGRYWLARAEVAETPQPALGMDTRIGR